MRWIEVLKAEFLICFIPRGNRFIFNCYSYKKVPLYFLGLMNIQNIRSNEVQCTKKHEEVEVSFKIKLNEVSSFGNFPLYKTSFYCFFPVTEASALQHSFLLLHNNDSIKSADVGTNNTSNVNAH